MASTRKTREQRRAELIERIASERREFERIALRLRGPVRRAERVRQRTKYVFTHFAAIWIPLATLLLLRLRPRRVVGAAARTVVKILPVFQVARRLGRVLPWAARTRRRLSGDRGTVH